MAAEELSRQAQLQQGLTTARQALAEGSSMEALHITQKQYVTRRDRAQRHPSCSSLAVFSFICRAVCEGSQSELGVSQCTRHTLCSAAGTLDSSLGPCSRYAVTADT